MSLPLLLGRRILGLDNHYIRFTISNHQEMDCGRSTAKISKQHPLELFVNKGIFQLNSLVII